MSIHSVNAGLDAADYAPAFVSTALKHVGVLDRTLDCRSDRLAVRAATEGRSLLVNGVSADVKKALDLSLRMSDVNGIADGREMSPDQSRMLVYSIAQLALLNMSGQGVQLSYDIEANDLDAMVEDFMGAAFSLTEVSRMPGELLMDLHELVERMNCDEKVWRQTLLQEIEAQFDDFDLSDLKDAAFGKKVDLDDFDQEDIPASTFSNIISAFHDELTLASNIRDQIKQSRTVESRLIEEIAELQSEIDLKMRVAVDINMLGVIAAADTLFTQDISQDRLKAMIGLNKAVEAGNVAHQEEVARLEMELKKKVSQLEHVRASIEVKEAKIDEILAEVRVHQARIDSN